MQPTACPELVEGAQAVGGKWNQSKPQRGEREATTQTPQGRPTPSRLGLTEFRFATEPTALDLPVPIALAGKSSVSPIIRRIEKTLDLIDPLAGVIVTNLNQSTRVL